MSRKSLLVYSDEYKSDLSVLGTAVSFAQDRGARVLDELKKEFGSDIKQRKPCPVTDKQLALVHTPGYLASLQMPLTWSQIFGTAAPLPDTAETQTLLKKLLSEYKLKAGGTLLAARIALSEGLAANLGAGYHHAYADKGDGFCLINDIAIAIRVLQSLGLVKKVLVIDTDFHQGNGTSKIFEGDDSVYTLDVHSKEGWPYRKEKSSHDVAIKKDEHDLYVERLRRAISKALKSFTPDLVIFVQGADAYEHGQINKGEGFALSLATMKERDELVIDTFKERNIPLALVFAGGYGDKAWLPHYQGVQHLLMRAGALTHRTDL